MNLIGFRKNKKSGVKTKQNNNISPDALKSQEVKQFITNSYNYANRDANINGYNIDNELSNRHAAVYYNPTTNRTVITHRGTEGNIGDWLNNAQYAIGNYNNTKRYELGKQTQNKVAEKYGNQNLTTIGHSQGSVLARKLGKDSKQIININPAYMGESQLSNEYVVRSNADPVSSLKPVSNFFKRIVRPGQAKNEAKRNININNKNMNLVNEHMPGILDRLGDRTIGTGINIKNVPLNNPIWNYSNPKKLRAIADANGYNNIPLFLSDKNDKKYMLINPQTNKKVYFGAMGYEDFLKHNDELRKNRFKKRNNRWKNNDKYSASKLSYTLLW